MFRTNENINSNSELNNQLVEIVNFQKMKCPYVPVVILS